MKNRDNFFIEPDEIFLDSKNLQNFDQQQFEGKIEKSISKKTIILLGFFFFIIIAIFSFQLQILQIGKGQIFFNRSQNNTLKKVLVFADRGIIYDRNKKELVWNKKNDESVSDNTSIPIRSYLSPGFSHILGYVTYPEKDNSGFYYQNNFIGIDGLEKTYDNLIEGKNGSKILEIDALGKVYTENIIEDPQRGEDLITTIDSRIQGALFSLLKNAAEKRSFRGGSGILLDINNGEIITSTSFPEYNSEILSLGQDKKIINNYLTDKRNFFLNRNISGLYTPGSIIKPILAMAALNENLIDPNKKILSTGSISIPNPYFPGKETIFKDWKAHGWIDMRKALAFSSNTYFYMIGGGYKEQKGLGIENIKKYARLFGIGEKIEIDLPGIKSGIIPGPEWKLKNAGNGPWRIGDTYHTAIGQYGFQITPLEIARVIAAIANNGKLVNPHFLLNSPELVPRSDLKNSNYELNATEKSDLGTNLDLKKEHFKIVQEGMREVVLNGTGYMLNVPYVKISAKTGTAQLGFLNERINSWVVGFFPSEKPKYAFVILLESGPSYRSELVASKVLAREFFDWMSINTPEYFD